MYNDQQTDAIASMDGGISEIEDTLRELRREVHRLKELGRPSEAHWECRAWRCRAKPLPCPGTGWFTETRCEIVDTWERVPGIVHTLIEWQLEEIASGEFQPDPGPIQIRYVPENGESGIGAF